MVMKKILFTLVFLLVSITTGAYDVKIDGIYYDVLLKGKIATVVKGEDRYSGEVTIPETIEYEGVTCTVTALDTHVFEGCNVTKVWFPDGITLISSYTFENCKYLESVRLPAKLEAIGSRAFYNCEKLSSLELPSSLKWIGSRAFCYCSQLTSLTLPQSLNTIMEYAFMNCKNLTSITLPDALEVLEEGVFSGCNSITSINIPKSLTIIPKDAFCGCKFKSVEIPNNIKTIGERALASTSIESIVIPESVTTFGPAVFSGCIDLASVKLPDNMTEIPIRFFWGCRSLKEIQIPESVTSIGQYAFADTGFDNIDFIPADIKDLKYVFSECKNLTTLTIPDGVDYISEGEFSDCVNLHTVVLPSSVKTIHNYAFSGCTALKEINLDHLTLITSRVFDGCISLEAVDMPLVEEIWQSAFQGCHGLKTITLGASIKSLMPSAFGQCESLEDFYCYAEVLPEIPERDRYSLFKDSYVEYSTLHVPASAIELYRSTSPWSSFGSIVPIETGVEQVTSDKSQVTSEEWYTLEGIRVAQPRKGVYIHNGKVVVIK